jgi:phosphatidylglycerophosphatase C
VLYACRVQLLSADEVWKRVESLSHAQIGGVIATDGDGTLWSGDVGEDLFHAFLDCGRVETCAAEEMRREAREHVISDAGSGPEVARRIYDAYLGGRYPEERICELMTWCFAGWRRDEVRSFAHDVAARAGIAERFQGEVVHVLDRARAARIEVFLVSASPIAIVAEAGSLAGFAEAQVIAAQPRYDGDVMVPGVERPIPYGAGKVTRLRERVGADALFHAAFGDNGFDVDLLASASLAVAVRPKPRLRDRAHTIKGLIELEPCEVRRGAVPSRPPLL